VNGGIAVGCGGLWEIICLRDWNLSSPVDFVARGMRPKMKAPLIEAVMEEVARRLSLCWMRGEWVNCSLPWQILEITCLCAGWD